MDNGASSYHRFLQGDKNGLEELVIMYNDSLIFFINGFINNIQASEDIAAETFFELIIRKNRFKENYLFKTWLFRIARNNTIDYIRKQNKLHIKSIEDYENELCDKYSLEEALLKDEQKKQLHKAMENISKDYKEVLHLLYFEDMSYDEAGIVLCKNNKQIKNLAYRAKLSLRAALEKEGFTYEDI